MSIQSEINRISGAKSDIADAIEDQGVTVPSGTKLDGMANLIGQISGGSGKLNSTQAADAYDPTATYAVGDKVSYAGNVYSCISAISTPEAWDSTHWDQVDPIQDQVDDVRNTLNQFDQNMAYVESGNTASRPYTYGQFISWKGVLYTVSDTNGISSGVSFSTGSNGNLAAVVDGNGVECGGLNSLNEKTIYIHASWTGAIAAGISYQNIILWTDMNMTVPSGYTPIRVIPYAENQGSMWYQIVFSAWEGSNKGLTYYSGYAWDPLTIDFIVECMKTTDFEAAKSR